MAPREYERSVLILDAADRRLSRTSLSLIALGHRPLYAADLDELVLIAQERRADVGAIMLPAAEALGWFAAVLERIAAPLVLSARAVMPVGAPLGSLEADALFAKGVRWALWQPYSPWELRFAVSRVLSDSDPNDERAEARVPCSIPVSVESHNRASSGQLTDLSSGGGFVQLDHPFPEGTAVEIRGAFGGRESRLRARVAWRSGAHTPGWCDTGIGIVFEALGLDTVGVLRQQVESSLDRFRIRPRATAQETQSAVA